MERQRWAEAQALQGQLGGDAARWLAQQVADLTQAGDRDGLLRVQAVAHRLDQLTRPGTLH